MDTDILPVEAEVAEVVTEYTLDSLQGIVHAMVGIAEDAKSKPMERLRALNQIAELRGFKIDRSTKDIRRFSTEELKAAILDLVLPTLAPFGVKPSREGLLSDAAGDETPS